MPANLGPEYKDAENRFRQATTPEERLEALQDMLRTIPKHKGTERMQGDLKRRISKARKEVQQSHKKGGSKPWFHVDKTGAGQITLVGPTNSGKSALLAALTNAHPDVAQYPYTTQLPMPGMMQYEDVQVQLVDLPAVESEATDGWVLGLIRNSDAVLVALDAASDDVLEEADRLFAFLDEESIALLAPDAADPPGGEGSGAAKRAIIAANKIDVPGAESNLALLEELVGGELPVFPVSAETGAGLDELKEGLFGLLKVIRVYTKAPGKPAEKPAPYVLKAGSTVLDAARAVHADFGENLKFARIWGTERYDGQMVSREDELSDKDLLELHV